MSKNKVDLVGWYGGDKAVARAAWTSTQIDVEAKTEEQIRDLIVNKLWNNDTGKPHKTPFERAIVEFNVTCDQASHIHLLKHRLANINGESARYMELKEDKIYLPEDWININVNRNDIFENNKDLHWYLHLTSQKDSDWFNILKQYSELGNNLYHQALKDLSPILGRKRAKESARFFKTMNSQITLSVMMNMSCFANFVNLRGADDAQLEIREITEQLVNIVKQIEGNPFKYTLEAFKL